MKLDEAKEDEQFPIGTVLLIVVLVVLWLTTRAFERQQVATGDVICAANGQGYVELLGRTYRVVEGDEVCRKQHK